jgi:DNA polymerase-3 subunit alpha
MLVFKADQAESAQVIQPDAIVLVRGRLDHKDRGETKLVVQEAQSFEPDEAEIASAAKKVTALPSGPLQVSIDLARLRTPGLMEDLKSLFEDHKGEARVHLVAQTSDGPRKLKIGEEYRVQVSPHLRYELNQLLGPDAIAA